MAIVREDMNSIVVDAVDWVAIELKLDIMYIPSYEWHQNKVIIIEYCFFCDHMAMNVSVVVT